MLCGRADGTCRSMNFEAASNADTDSGSGPSRWAGRVEATLADVPADSLEVHPIHGLHGLANFDVRPPGSKSITNRALICAALADGPTTLAGVLFADDTVAMLECLGALGVGIEEGDDATSLLVRGGGGAVSAGDVSLDANLSGTTARFIAPVASLLAQRVTLDGGEPLRRRPMGELFDAMRDLGVTIDTGSAEDRLPAQISGALRGGPVTLSADVSSQFLSALLLSAPVTEIGLEVRIDSEVVSAPYVDMTLRVMESFGAEIERTDDTITVAPSGYRSPGEYVVEPDASAASYFMAAPAICGGRSRIIDLDLNSMQGDIRLVEILDAMGMYIVARDGFIEVRETGDLHGVEIDMSDCSDVAQTLAIVATQADSPTRVTGIGFIRAKETDRIAAVVTELRRLGIDATEEPDGFVVRPGSGAPNPGVVSTYDDHRMAMSFALLGLRYPGITIADPKCVAKTYPSFWHDLGQVR